MEERAIPKRKLAAIMFTDMVGYAALGMHNEAIELIERRIEEHDRSIIFLKTYPQLESLRSDPRYSKLLITVGLNP